MSLNYKKINKGFGLIEIVIGTAIILSGILAANTAYNTYVQYALANQKNTESSYLLGEGLEAVTIMRDNSWSTNISTLSTTTTYYLFWNGSNWSTLTTPIYIDGKFLRSINIQDVRRNGSDDISSSGAIDPNTKQITATISYWQGHATTTRSLSTYITNLYNN